MDDKRRPMQIKGFKITAPVTQLDATAAGDVSRYFLYNNVGCVANITFTLDDYSDMLSEAEIAIPSELRDEILVLLQNHLDNRGKR